MAARKNRRVREVTVLFLGDLKRARLAIFAVGRFEPRTREYKTSATKVGSMYSLQGLARYRMASTADVIALQFAVKRGAADAKHFPRECFVTFDLLEDALDGGAFDVFEVGG